MPSERILIADDEPDVLDVARLTLELDGYEISTARDGIEAVEMAKQGNFDLLLTDVKMPRMDGLDAFQEVRRIDPSVVGVVMTGYGTMSIAIQAIKKGFADFVIKPFTPDELTDAVARSLEKERLRQENVRLKALIPLFDLSRHFMTETHLPSLLERVVQTALSETRAARAVLLLRVNGGNRFLEVAQAGSPVEEPEAWRNLASQVARARQPLLLGGHELSPSARSASSGSLLALPLFSKERVLGVLILNKSKGALPFTDADAELLNVVAGQAAVAIDNARLFEEREEAYRELEQIDHMKSEFINIAAHELRTPLSLVLGYSGLLEEEGEGEIREYADAITQNALRLRAIVEDMTNLRYLEMNQAQLDLESLDLLQITRHAAETARLARGNKQVELKIQAPPNLSRVRADRKKLELILGNLLSNAFKFSPADEPVIVQVKETPDAFYIAIADRGPGIPPAEQSKIWRRFYQVEASLTRAHGGLGLGLAIVKGMVELHGGEVWVESEENEGSTFHFTIPKRGFPR